MTQAFICDAIRSPFGRYGGALSSVRTDDLGAIPLRALMERNPGVDWAAVTDVIYGCANQAGEDNRNVAHMSSLLAGLPIEVRSPGSKADFYFSFLRRAVDRFAPEPAGIDTEPGTGDADRADPGVLAPCARCGSPTSTEVCAFCRLVERAGGSPPDAPPARPVTLGRRGGPDPTGTPSP